MKKLGLDSFRVRQLKAMTYRKKAERLLRDLNKLSTLNNEQNEKTDNGLS